VLFRAALATEAIDDIRLALTQNQPLGKSRFRARIERELGDRRVARPRRRLLGTKAFRCCLGWGSCCDCKTNDAPFALLRGRGEKSRLSACRVVRINCCGTPGSIRRLSEGPVSAAKRGHAEVRWEKGLSGVARAGEVLCLQKK